MKTIHRIDGHLKAVLTAIVLLVSWSTIAPVFAETGPFTPEQIADHRAQMQQRFAEMNKSLSQDQVRDIVEGYLAMRRKTNIKVGKVTEKDEEIIAAEIVTNDGSLVDVVEISRRTGFPANRQFRQRGSRQMGTGFHGHRLNRMGRGFGSTSKDLELSVDDVRTLTEARLILRGNDRLKVGSVEEKDQDTIVVGIVTVDGSLVMRREIDRHTGRPSRIAH